MMRGSITMCNGASIHGFLHMALLNSLVFGLEMCASAGFTYIPPMLLEAGISSMCMSIILVMGPVLGVIFVPVLAMLSDNYSDNGGRQRLPFILSLSAVVLISLLLIVSSVNSDSSAAISLLVIGIILLDFSTQACFNPFEALISDMFDQNFKRRDKCFMVYSAMTSLGGCIGYLIAALDWNTTAVGEYIGGGQERTVFILLSLTFVVSICCTLSVIIEKPLFLSKAQRQSSYKPGRKLSSSSVLSLQVDHSNDTSCLIPAQYGNNNYCINNLLPVLISPLSFIQHSFLSIIFAPRWLRQLFFCHLCCYTALFCHNLFYTDFVGQIIYGGNPNAGMHSVQRSLYDAGVRAGSWGLFLHCVTAALYSLVIDKLVVMLGMGRVFVLATVTFTLSMLMSVFVTNIYILSMLTATTGILLSTMSTLPYTLVSRRRSSNGRRRDGERGVGSDMAVLDTAYFLSQILMPSLMPLLVHMSGGRGSGMLHMYFIMAATFGALGCCLLVTTIKFDDTYNDVTHNNIRKLSLS